MTMTRTAGALLTITIACLAGCDGPATSTDGGGACASDRDDCDGFVDESLATTGAAA